MSQPTPEGAVSAGFPDVALSGRTPGCRNLQDMETKEAARATTADIRQWARARGFAVAERGRIPGALRELYLARPEIVRAWARGEGIQIGERGPLPAHVLESYLARPAAVRKWAKERGIEVARRGRIPGEVVERYLAPYRELARSAS